MSLMLCELGHAQLVYDASRWLCPGCALLADLRAARHRGDEAALERDELAAMIDDLESRLASAKDGRIDAERELARQRMASRA